jgi:hypothetical protein
MHRLNALGHRRTVGLLGLLICVFASGAALAQERDRWSVEPSLYLFLAGLTGTVGVGSIEVDLDSPSSALVHINFALMGSVRVAYGPWALTTDAMYADLGATKGDSSGSVQELIVEPTISYRVFPWLEPLAGVRYDRVGGDVTTPSGQSHALTQGWLDPIVGVRLRLSLSDDVSLGFRGDIGGFGVGSRLTWQLFPYVSWRVARSVSLQAGYRVLSIDYENGTGNERVLYDVIELGPQLGVNFPFDL